ncbi:N-acetylglucosamine-6-phosphate deacetylase [Leifsonia bigeumensis]|uniref:N-acetylglucosamine-6-phosphate deacetylase n=1 Tax=Leifsonella bigeumensis TaxID=433643 RepID=A0ABP7FH76_9MICO
MIKVREALVGPDIVADSEVLQDHSVLVRDGRIEAIVPLRQVPTDYSKRELGQGILTAGLVDIHTHGAGGRGFNEGDAGGHRQALEAYLAAGVTSLLPTMSAAPIEDLVASLEVVDSIRSSAGLPRIEGAHLEGPYFSDAQRGAQDPRTLRMPDDGSVEQLLDHARVIRMMSLAPELPGAVRLTERLVSLDIVAAAGHTDGRDEDLFACQRAGLSHVIHVFSGQSTTVREGPWRRPGMLEATLASDLLTVEMIGDGKHLPPTLMKLAMRCLPDRLCLVSDSTPGAGLPDGSRYGMGDNEYLVEDGVGVTTDRTAFAGSTTLISQMLPIVSQLGVGLTDLIAMATSIPAHAARLSEVGRIAPGYHADFALFDEALSLRSVALAGRW